MRSSSYISGNSVLTIISSLFYHTNIQNTTVCYPTDLSSVCINLNMKIKFDAALCKTLQPPPHTPKLYKTLQQLNTPSNNKYHLWAFSGIKPIKNTPENTSSNKVTTPKLMTVACEALLKRIVNKNPTHNEIIDFWAPRNLVTRLCS